MGLIKQYIPTNFININGPCRIGITVPEKSLMNNEQFYFQIMPVNGRLKTIFIGKTGRYDFKYTLEPIEYIYFPQVPYGVTVMIAKD